jgi:hypothetical protein
LPYGAFQSSHEPDFHALGPTLLFMAKVKVSSDLEFLVTTGVTAPWWRDGREKHCAYCGIAMRQKGTAQVPTKATADHIIATSHGGPALTIPACRACNEAKASKGLPEYLVSDYFQNLRANKKHGRAWPLHELWAVHAIAALRKTNELMEKVPTAPMKPVKQ